MASIQDIIQKSKALNEALVKKDVNNGINPIKKSTTPASYESSLTSDAGSYSASSTLYDNNFGSDYDKLNNVITNKLQNKPAAIQESNNISNEEWENRVNTKLSGMSPKLKEHFIQMGYDGAKPKVNASILSGLVAEKKPLNENVIQNQSNSTNMDFSDINELIEKLVEEKVSKILKTKEFNKTELNDNSPINMLIDGKEIKICIGKKIFGGKLKFEKELE